MKATLVKYRRHHSQQHSLSFDKQKVCVTLSRIVPFYHSFGKLNNLLSRLTFCSMETILFVHTEPWIHEQCRYLITDRKKSHYRHGTCKHMQCLHSCMLQLRVFYMKLLNIDSYLNYCLESWKLIDTTVEIQ